MTKKRKPVRRRGPLLSQWWIWLIILILLALLTVGAGGWYRLKQESSWDSSSRLNLIVIGTLQSDQLQIFSIESTTPTINQNQIAILDIPPEVKLNVSHGYGPYLAGALYELAVQESNLELLTQTLQQELGIPISGYVITDNVLIPHSNSPLSGTDTPSSDRGKTGRGRLSNQLRSWQAKDVVSSLSWGDRVKIWWQSRQVSQDKITYMDFSQGNWARPESEIDGQPIIWFDQTTIDTRLPQLMADSRVLLEGLAVRIINTTDINGLGSQVSRIINGLGARVIEVTNAQGAVNRCLISANENAKSSYTVIRLQQIFDCQLVDLPLADDRADIELKTGWEQARAWQGRDL